MVVNLTASEINENPVSWALLIGVSLARLFEAETSILNLGHAFYWQPIKKDREEENFAFCLLALTLTGNIILPVPEASLQRH